MSAQEVFLTMDAQIFYAVLKIESRTSISRTLNYPTLSVVVIFTELQGALKIRGNSSLSMEYHIA